MANERIPIDQIVSKDEPEVLVREAKKLAGVLYGDNTTRTQIRRLFATLRLIERKWPDSYRELVLFGPRLAYQAERHNGIKQLADVIQEGIGLVHPNNKAELERLIQFFEATLAYYIASKK